MAPENAQIFLVEDNAKVVKTLTEYLENAGHEVVETATSLQEALSKIPTLSQKGVNVAILDGNLTEGEESGQEGEIVAEAIKAQLPYVIVIGSTGEIPISAAHINCPKPMGASKLTQTVTQA